MLIPSTPQPKKVNYLNNKDMLLEIHRSKNSYCEFDSKDVEDYDLIVENLNDCLTEENLLQAKKKRADRLTQRSIDEYCLKYNETAKKAKSSIQKLDESDIPTTDLVFRVVTYDHIPLDPTRKKNPKTIKEMYAKLNFTPFKHYVVNENNELVEVGRSHHKNGSFTVDGGKLTDKLARMFILLVNKYSQKSNWRGYTYLEEMKGQALLQLASMALQFDEHKSDNPFAYYTASISNSFTRILNIEKRNQNIRDDLLQQMGQNPSLTRQLEHDEEIRLMRESHEDKED